MNNLVGEAAALFDAGRLFLRAEEALKETNALSCREYMDCFISCSLKAAKVNCFMLIWFSVDLRNH